MTDELEHSFVISPLSGDGETVTISDFSRARAAQDVVPGTVRRGPLGAVEVEVVVDGWRFMYLVESSGRARLREQGVRAGRAAGVAGATEVRAMIPGRVVAVSVTAGDTVKGGEPLLTVEAMKMQNEVRAPTDGTVAHVAVGVGDRVEQGDVLVTFQLAPPLASAERNTRTGE